MVEELICRYIALPWIDRLDFSTLEMVPAHYFSEKLEHRESDVVWRLRYRGSGLRYLGRTRARPSWPGSGKSSPRE